jgi:PAS domain S-box-containing protein
MPYRMTPALRGALPPAATLDPTHAVEFDRVTRVATRALGAPVAQFNVITEAEQVSASSVGPGPWQGRRAVPRDASYCQHVLDTGQALVIDDARTHPLVCENPATAAAGIGAYAGVPVVLGDGTVAGVLCVIDFVPREWTAEEEGLLGDLAASLASRIELTRYAVALQAAHDQLEARVAERTAELTRLNTDLQHEVERRRQSEDSLRASEERFRATFEQAAVGIAAVAPDGHWLRVNARFSEIVGYGEAALRERTIWDITHPDDRQLDREPRAQLLAGEISAYQVEKRYVHRAGHVVWVRLTTSVVRDAAGAPEYVLAVMEDITERRRTAEDLRLAQFEIVERLAQAAEFRDDDTGQHTRRVGELSARIGQALGLPPDEVELLRRAAPLHDVGKIGISDSILLKPGKLTVDEYTVMRTHTVIGAQILASGTSALMRTAEVIARAHHERWDGAGYPDGLAGATIPLVARIVAVADFYDALTSDRPYRRAWPRERVLAEIERSVGTHFDPRVARAFLEIAEA